MALHLPRILPKGCCRLTRSLSTWNNNPTVATTTTVEPQRNIHVTPIQDYPAVAPLPLPDNIDPNETIQWSPQRSRDIGQYSTSISLSYNNPSCYQDAPQDPHVASYDSQGTVNLNCTMQSNVPEPFTGKNFAHLNMPGGSWSQNSKFMSQDLQASHYTNLRQQVRSDWDKKGWSTTIITGTRKFHTLTAFNACATNHSNRRMDEALVHFAKFSNNAPATPPGGSTGAGKEEEPPKEMTKKEQLKRAFKDYGSTVIVFHVGMSLVSLGMFYTLVSSGLDVAAIMEYLNLGDSVLASKMGTGASTFVIAYSVHKVFAPVRISITLGATPFLVRVLRRKGMLKK